MLTNLFSLVTISLLLCCVSLTQAQQLKRSTANIFGGQNYPDGYSRSNIFGGQDYHTRNERVTSQPNIFGGMNYSNGWMSRSNIFGGQTFQHRSGKSFFSTTPNIFGGQNYPGGYSAPNVSGGWNFYRR